MRCYRNLLGVVLLAMLAFSRAAFAQPAASKPEVLVIDAAAPAHPFPHFWEHMFGSGRASLSMRESYRQDLRQVKQITDVRYIRFHAIFLDEMGVYDEDSAGRPVYNFSYVDQVYDGLLQNGVRPFVELSFMPKKLASKDAPHAFWYKQNVAPPKDWAKWDDLIYQFTKHLVDRYGMDEVAKWYFEVWNEPNIDFWVGDPKQATYFELYDHSAEAVKRVNSGLRVGGPATAQAAWADAFIQHCVDKHVPVDFVSTHVYGNDGAQDVFGTNENIPRDRMVCRAVKKVHDQIKASSLPALPLIWSEFNASYKNEPEITDSIYMGPWMADTIRQCDGLVDEMSYWTFLGCFRGAGRGETAFLRWLWPDCCRRNSEASFRGVQSFAPAGARTASAGFRFCAGDPRRERLPGRSGMEPYSPGANWRCQDCRVAVQESEGCEPCIDFASRPRPWRPASRLRKNGIAGVSDPGTIAKAARVSRARRSGNSGVEGRRTECDASA